MTRRKRIASAEETEQFREALNESVPLTIDPAHKPKAAKPARGEPVTTKTPAPKTLGGLDGRTTERMRRGQLEPQSRLDLHGLTEAAAHRALIAFLHGARARGNRFVLVVTGKGLKPPDADAPFDMERDLRARGVLRTMTPRWLAGPELSPLIADIRPAHRRHGGGGALYIYLRKR